jgi:hypothetical protein
MTHLCSSEWSTRTSPRYCRAHKSWAIEPHYHAHSLTHSPRPQHDELHCHLLRVHIVKVGAHAACTGIGTPSLLHSFTPFTAQHCYLLTGQQVANRRAVNRLWDYEIMRLWDYEWVSEWVSDEWVSETTDSCINCAVKWQTGFNC